MLLLPGGLLFWGRSSRNTCSLLAYPQNNLFVCLLCSEVATNNTLSLNTSVQDRRSQAMYGGVYHSVSREYKRSFRKLNTILKKHLKYPGGLKRRKKMHLQKFLSESSCSCNCSLIQAQNMSTTLQVHVFNNFIDTPYLQQNYTVICALYSNEFPLLVLDLNSG